MQIPGKVPAEISHNIAQACQVVAPIKQFFPIVWTAEKSHSPGVQAVLSLIDQERPNDSCYSSARDQEELAGSRVEKGDHRRDHRRAGGTGTLSHRPMGALCRMAGHGLALPGGFHSCPQLAARAAHDLRAHRLRDPGHVAAANPGSR